MRNVTRPTPSPPTRLAAFAETIASASDPALAAWQVSGLVDSRSPARNAVRAVAALALAIGLVVAGIAAWFVAPPLLGLAGAFLASGGRRLRDAAAAVALAGLLVLIIGGASAFGAFHILSRAVYFRVRRPRE